MEPYGSLHILRKREIDYSTPDAAIAVFEWVNGFTTFRLFRLGRSGLDPRVEHRNAGLFEITGITRDDR